MKIIVLLAVALALSVNSEAKAAEINSANADKIQADLDKYNEEHIHEKHKEMFNRIDKKKKLEKDKADKEKAEKEEKEKKAKEEKEKKEKEDDKKNEEAKKQIEDKSTKDETLTNTGSNFIASSYTPVLRSDINYSPISPSASMYDANSDGKIDTLDFIEIHSSEIIAVARQTGIYPSIIMAQLIHESGRDMTNLAKAANNFFGIKYFSGLQGYGAAQYSHPTFEIENGQRVNTNANFAAFPDFKSSLNAFVDLYWNGKYDNTVKKEIYDLENATPDSMVEAINQSPYASNPTYNKILYDCINTFGFAKYDAIAFPDGRKQASKLDGSENYTIGTYPDDGLNLKDVWY